MASEEMEGLCPLPEVTGIKVEPSVSIGSAEDTNSQNAMGIKFILPNRFDMNVCSRFVKSLNEEDSKNIQDQVNSDLEVASVLFKGKANDWSKTTFFWVNILLGNSFKCPVSVFSLSTAECNIQTSPSPGIQVRHVYTPSTTKHFSPIKQSTTLTNKHRGNEVSSTPLLVHCKSSCFSFGKIFANLIFKTITIVSFFLF